MGFIGRTRQRKAETFQVILSVMMLSLSGSRSGFSKLR
jgi:hypothetical protein